MSKTSDSFMKTYMQKVDILQGADLGILEDIDNIISEIEEFCYGHNYQFLILTNLNFDLTLIVQKTFSKIINTDCAEIYITISRDDISGYEGDMFLYNQFTVLLRRIKALEGVQEYIRHYSNGSDPADKSKFYSSEYVF